MRKFPSPKDSLAWVNWSGQISYMAGKGLKKETLSARERLYNYQLGTCINWEKFPGQKDSPAWVTLSGQITYMAGKGFPVLNIFNLGSISHLGKSST